MNVSIRRAGDWKRPYGGRKVFVSEMGKSRHESGALDSGALPIAAKFNGYRAKNKSINHA